MTTAEKLTKVAQNEQKTSALNTELETRLNGGEVLGGSYYDAFWDAFQNSGNRTDYRFAFAGWMAYMMAFLKPKYNIRPVYASNMFNMNKAITDLVSWCEECGIVLDFSQCIDFTHTFQNSSIKHVGIIDTRKSANVSYIMYNTQIKTVDKIILKDDGSQTSSTFAFQSASLENITFEGIIGQNFWFNTCTNLTTASLLSILTALTKDSTKANGKTVTLATAHKAKIEADADCTAQLNAAVAAGWTVAYA